MEQETKTRTKRKSHTVVSAVIVTLVILIGLSLLLYPTVSNYVHSLDYKKDIDAYQQNVQKLDDTTVQNMLKDARAWNGELVQNSRRFGTLNAEQAKRYTSLLDPSGTGMMGYVEIEKLNIYLPVYHGTDEAVLQSGIGHLAGSSLPVGGKGTHTFLSGHSGLPSSKLFSNIDQLETGDTFTLHVLGEELTYRVESVTVVLPEEAEKQEVDPEADLCTLMTCTPYGINTHRLLVRGVRTQTPQTGLANSRKAADTVSLKLPMTLWAAVIVLALAAVLSILLAVKRTGRRK